RGGRPAQRRGRTAADVDDVAAGMANPHRDADAALMHARCLSAAGKPARLGGGNGSLSSRLGPRDCARVPLTVNSLGAHLALTWRTLARLGRIASGLAAPPLRPARHARPHLLGAAEANRS